MVFKEILQELWSTTIGLGRTYIQYSLSTEQLSGLFAVRYFSHSRQGGISIHNREKNLP